MGGREAGHRVVAQTLAAIADASSLIVLEQIGLLQSLEPLFSVCLIPPAVAREIAPTVTDRPTWIVEQPLRQPLDVRVLNSSLGRGEIEAIGLALELGSYGIIIDDRQARRLAESLGLSVAGTVRILLEAKAAGLLPEIRPWLHALQEVGFFLSATVLNDALTEAGESYLSL